MPQGVFSGAGRHRAGLNPRHGQDAASLVEVLEMSAGMKTKRTSRLVDGARCKVIGGTHAGKAGTVRDIKTSKTGHVTITVVQDNGERFKTLARNVVS